MSSELRLNAIGVNLDNKKAEVAVSRFSGADLPDTRVYDVPQRLVPIENLCERSVNDFDMTTSLQPLVDSILDHGLIHPIVIIEDGHDHYYINSGNRRYRAWKQIYEGYAALNDPRAKEYRDIPALIYKIGTPEEAEKHPDIITVAQEEQMYQDSNLQVRQMHEKDVVRHIRYIMDRYPTDSDYYKKAEKAIIDAKKQKNKEKGTKSYNSKPSASDVYAYMLQTEFGFVSWNKTKSFRFNKLYEAMTTNTEETIRRGATNLYNQLVDDNNSLTVSGAYKQLRELIDNENNAYKEKVVSDESLIARKAVESASKTIDKLWNNLSDIEKKDVYVKLNELYENVKAKLD